MPYGPLINLLSIGLIISGAFTLISLLLGRIKAPYGRYTTSGWGLKIGARTAWVVQESPCLIMVMVSLFFAGPSFFNNPVAVLLLGLFTLHYAFRTLIYPFKIKSTNKTPLSIVGMAFLFCALNGFCQSFYLTQVGNYPPNYAFSPQFGLGVLIFFLGFAINLHSDGILRSLRTKQDKSYKIPHGGLFNFVSCANYCGEIIEWVGFAIACGSLPGWMFAFFTFCNLAPRALEHHRWYNKTFADYPKNRKALLPFLL